VRLDRTRYRQGEESVLSFKATEERII